MVGSAPYCDPDPEGNITAVFDLAVEFNVDVDFHLGQYCAFFFCLDYFNLFGIMVDSIISI